jgi:hypothetical protein
VGSAAVIGDEGAGRASAEGVEEHADRECEQSLRDPLHEALRCFREVLFEPHLAFRFETFDSITSRGPAECFSQARLSAVRT